MEAKKESGVGFFSDSGELLCVIFDEVRESQDHQTLEFSHYCATITVKNNKVKYNITQTIQSP